MDQSGAGWKQSSLPARDRRICCAVSRDSSVSRWQWSARTCADEFTIAPNGLHICALQLTRTRGGRKQRAILPRAEERARHARQRRIATDGLASILPSLSSRAEKDAVRKGKARTTHDFPFRAR